MASGSLLGPTATSMRDSMSVVKRKGRGHFSGATVGYFEVIG